MSYPAMTIQGNIVQIVGKEFVTPGEIKPVLVDSDGGRWTWENSDPHTLVPVVDVSDMLADDLEAAAVAEAAAAADAEAIRIAEAGAEAIAEAVPEVPSETGVDPTADPATPSE